VRVRDRILYVTGADAAYFPMLCALLFSFRSFSHGPGLRVADFGLSAPQKAFFRRQGLLLEKPDFGESGVHPFFYKGSLWDYARQASLEYDALVWIDCDALVVGPLTREVEALIAGHAAHPRFVAVCGDAGGALENVVSAFPMEPFRRLLLEHGLSLALPYLNTGLIVIRDEQSLREWGERTRSVAFHTLFEQNVFNLVAHKNFRDIHLLDPQVWNVHDRDLDALVVEPAAASQPPRVRLGDKQPLVVHATSVRSRATWQDHVEIDLGGGSLEGEFRRIFNPAVDRLFQASLRGYLEEQRAALIECGVATPRGA
jgi:hypothetical protein